MEAYFAIRLHDIHVPGLVRNLLNRALGRYIDDNSWYLCVEIFWAAVYGSAQTFAGAYAIRLGATNAQVSLLTSIPALTAALVLLPAGQFLHSRERRKNWLLGALFIMRIGTLLYVLLPWVNPGSVSQGLLFVIIFCALTIPAHFFNLGFIPFLAQAIPDHHRADTFATRNALASAVTSTFSLLFGFWLGRVAFPGNYQLMYLFGFAIAMVSLYYLSKVHVTETPHPAEAKAASSAGSSARQWLASLTIPWQLPGITRIFVNTLLHSLGLWAAAPLYVLYYVRTLGATEAWLGTLGSVASLSAILGYVFWRRIINRQGEARVLQWTIVAVGLYPFLAGSIPSLPVILLAAGLNGLAAAGVGLSHFNVFLRLIPEAHRHNYTALYLTLLNVGAFVSPLISINLANLFGFAPVLIVCGLLSIIGSVSFWIWPVGDGNLAPEGRRY